MLVAAVTLAPLLQFLPNSALPQAARLQQARTSPARAIAAAALPRLTVTAGEVTEGGALVFTIAISPAPTKPVPIEYAFSGDVSALVNARGGSAMLQPGRPLEVPRQTVDDDIVNSDRRVVLTAAMPSLIRTPSGPMRDSKSGTVRDNDVAKPPPPPPAALPSVRVANSGPVTEGSELLFPLQLSRESDLPVTVFYRLNDPDGISTDSAGGSVIIPAGEPGGVIPVGTIDDSAVNGLRAVTVQLLRTSNAVLGRQRSARGVVADNDVAPPPVSSYSIAVAAPEVAEGTALTFTVTRSGDLSQAGAVSYSQTIAVEGRTGLPVRKTVEFPPQVAARSFDFNPNEPILHDMLVQVILLQNDGEPQLSNRLALGTIMDDPAIPAIEETVTPTETVSGMATEIGPTGPAIPTDGPIDNRAWYDPIDLGWPSSLIPIVVLVCGIAAAIWWLKRDPDPISDPEPISDPDPIPDPIPPPPPVPECGIDCAPRWDAAQEPSSIGPLTLPELHFNIRAVPGDPTTPFEIGATFLEERDEPDDQL